jgi:hypothetical protein
MNSTSVAVCAHPNLPTAVRKNAEPTPHPRGWAARLSDVADADVFDERRRNVIALWFENAFA